MADINTEVVGAEPATRQQRQKHKLDFKEFKLKTSIDDAFYADETFSMLMGDQVAPRKNFIITNSKLVDDLDI